MASLGEDQGGYGDWSVIAAHFERFALELRFEVRQLALLFPVVVPVIDIGHQVLDWDMAEERVVRSLTTPQYVGPRYNLFTTPPCSLAPPTGLLGWVKSIRYCSFGNAKGEGDKDPQGIAHNGWGHVIEMGELPTTPPPALGRPTFTYVPSSNSIEVTALLPAEASWFDVYYRRKLTNRRRDLQQTYDVIPDNEAGATPEIDNLVSGATYRIKVRAYSTRAKSTDSAEVDVTAESLAGCGSASSSGVSGSAAATTACLALLPTGPTASNPTWNSLTLNWRVSSDATGYEVKRTQLDHCQDDVESVVEISSQATTSHSFADLDPDTSYLLCVRTVREIFEPDFLSSYEVRSDWSSAADRTAVLPAPTNLTVSEVTGAGATLRWRIPDNEINDVVVQRDGDDVRSLAGRVLSYPFTSADGFRAHTAHKLGVASVYKHARSAFTVLTLLVPPTLDTPTATASAITVSWRSDPQATGYDVKRVASAGDCSAGSPDDRVTTTSYTFAIPSAERDREHRLCIRASDSRGVSAWASGEGRTQAQSAAVTIDASGIAGDGTVNIAEKADGFSISGTATPGASVSLTVGETTLTAVAADEAGAWSVTVPANSSDVEESLVSVTAEASKEDHESAAATETFRVDLTAPMVSYPSPSNLQVDTEATVTPMTSHTDIDAYALATGQTLPAGLSLDGSTGAVSGTPEARGDDVTTTNIVVSDHAGNRSTATLSLPRVDGLEQTLEGFRYGSAEIAWGDDEPTLTAPTGAVGALSYSASPTSVCEVDAASGALTVDAPGTCTIAATAAPTTTHEAGTATATLKIIVPTPTDLTVSNVTDTGATLTWRKPYEEISDYVVQLDGDDVDTSVGDVLSFSFDADDGLTANTAHTLGVAAVQGGIRSTFAELTLLLRPTLGTPTVTENSISLTWTLDDDATGAQVRLGDSGDFGDPDEDTSHTFAKLESGTEYQVYVRATNARGESAPAHTSATTLGCAGERPTKPETAQDVTGLAFRWVLRGTTAHHQEGTETHRQVRTVDWSGQPDCEWLVGEWRNSGDPTYSDWADTTITWAKPRTTEPAGTGSTRWVLDTDNSNRACSQLQHLERSRTVTFSATKGWDVGDWGDAYHKSWVTTGTCKDKPATTEPAGTGETRWAVDTQNSDRACSELEQLERSRTVTFSATKGWNVGKWGESYHKSWEPAGCEDKGKTSETRPAGTGETRCVVSGDMACEEIEHLEQLWVRSITFSSASGWVRGEWETSGDPYRKSWERTSRPCWEKPADDVVSVVIARTTQTRWVAEDDGIFCLEYEEQRTGVRRSYYLRPHVWSDADKAWVDGTRSPLPYFTEPVFSYSPWSRTGTSRLCPFGAGEDGASGESEPSSGYRPARFGAGEHRLAWGTSVLAVTVPADATLELHVRTTESDAERLVFRTTAAAELEVDPSQLSSDAAQNATLFSAVTDETLASMAATLRLLAPTAAGAAGAAGADGASECVSLQAPSDGVAALDLDAATCIVVRGGGSVAVTHEGHGLSAILPVERDWLVLSARHAEDAAFDAIWFVDLQSGAALALSPLDGSEVDRQVRAGDLPSTARLDAVAASANVRSGSAER